MEFKNKSMGLEMRPNRLELVPINEHYMHSVYILSVKWSLFWWIIILVRLVNNVYASLLLRVTTSEVCLKKKSLLDCMYKTSLQFQTANKLKGKDSSSFKIHKILTHFFKRH